MPSHLLRDFELAAVLQARGSFQRLRKSKRGLLHIFRSALPPHTYGNVALIWPSGDWAPKNQHAFFGSPGGSYGALSSRISKSLYCQAR